MLLDSFCRAEPVNSFTRELLESGLQLGCVKVEVIHGANAKNTVSRPARTHAIHEGATNGAEIVGHVVSGRNRLGLAIGSELLAAARMFQVCIGDDKVGGEHGRVDFVVVAAVAEEAVDQPRGFGCLITVSEDHR